MELDISVAVPAAARVGEGPFWRGSTRRLTWVDILRGEVHTSDPSTGATLTTAAGTLIGAAVPRRSGGFVTATREGFATMDTELHPRLSILGDGFRMNDAKCDGAGRLWSGSTDMAFAPGAGALHVLAPDWTVETVLEGLTLPNGLGWSPDRSIFYLVDSIEGEVNSFACEPGSGAISNRRLLTTIPAAIGLPDGLTIDAAGCLWIAIWGGGRILRISPEGEILQTVIVPVAQPSSCTFGGPALDVLYVTTAREGLALDPDDIAGSVLAVRGLGVCGLADQEFGG